MLMGHNTKAVHSAYTRLAKRKITPLNMLGAEAQERQKEIIDMAKIA